VWVGDLGSRQKFKIFMIWEWYLSFYTQKSLMAYEPRKLTKILRFEIG
jgi:hypothetical protein